MATDPLEVILTDMDRFIGRKSVGLIFEIHAVLTERTPVDLGWARANWVPKIGSPHRENLNNAEPTGGAAQSRASKTASELGQIAASYSIEMGALFVSNNVPYIGRLNDGHSKQQGPGYIQLAVLSAVATKKAER